MNCFLNSSDFAQKSSLKTNLSLIEMLNTPSKTQKKRILNYIKKDSDSSTTVDDLTELSFETINAPTLIQKKIIKNGHKTTSNQFNSISIQ